MIRSERIAKKINEYIKTWSRTRGRFVVGIDGYAGSGKTTVANCVSSQNPDVLAVHLDDFIHHWRDREAMIQGAEDKSKVFEFEWYRYDDLKKLIQKFISGKEKSISLRTYDYNSNDFEPEKEFDLTKRILVIDGIFLFHPMNEISKLFDRKVYLNIDFAKADEQRIAREKQKWGEKYLPEDHPDNWVRYFKEAYRRYIDLYDPNKMSDLVFKIEGDSYKI